MTLKPDSKTTEKTSTFFDTTKHAVKKAISLKKDVFLSMPKRTKRQGISDEDLQVVTNFFTNDEYSRLLPAKKDYVSVRIKGKKQHMQKRLLFGTLFELYEAFKVDHPAIKLSFAKFCSVRPKWCKHNACVCAKNIKIPF